MDKLDIRFCKLILIGAGLVIIAAELYLLADQYLTGFQGLFPAWAKVLIVAGGLGVILLALAAKVEE